MDKIEAKMSKSPHMGDIVHLCIFLNGERLDQFLTSNVSPSFLGLIPSWLDFYDENFEPSMAEKEYVWEKTKLDDKVKILPILLCPDDFDFSCTVIVVEVINESDIVVWNRFGIDMTKFDPNEKEWPKKYVGKTVEWFDNSRPYIFDKEEYINCIEIFLQMLNGKNNLHPY